MSNDNPLKMLAWQISVSMQAANMRFNWRLFKQGMQGCWDELVEVYTATTGDGSGLDSEVSWWQQAGDKKAWKDCILDFEKFWSATLSKYVKFGQVKKRYELEKQVGLVVESEDYEDLLKESSVLQSSLTIHNEAIRSAISALVHEQPLMIGKGKVMIKEWDEWRQAGAKGREGDALQRVFKKMMRRCQDTWDGEPKREMPTLRASKRGKVS